MVQAQAVIHCLTCSDEWCFTGLQQAVALTSDQHGAQLKAQAFLQSGPAVQDHFRYDAEQLALREKAPTDSRSRSRQRVDFSRTGLDLVILERNQCQAISWLQRRIRDLMRSDGGPLPFLRICKVKVPDSCRNLVW